jgi:hypothetical protein
MMIDAIKPIDEEVVRGIGTTNINLGTTKSLQFTIKSRIEKISKMT